MIMMMMMMMLLWQPHPLREHYTDSSSCLLYKQRSIVLIPYAL